MILRRIIEHVKAQHWTAIVIDFVIVVVGVFIGIQVSNWNDAQAERRLGQSYVERLRLDVENDKVFWSNLVAYYGAVLESIDQADTLLADPAGDAKATVLSAYRASEISNSPQTRATWDEIVSSGHVGLLPRELLDSGLAIFYSIDVANQSFLDLRDSAYRHRARSLIPLSIQKAIRATCSDLRDEAERVLGFMPECRLDVEPALLEATAAALRADAQLKAALHYQYSQVFTAQANIRGGVVLLERALAVLKGDRKPGAAP